KVEEEIDRLLKENIIEPVDTINEPLEWASPVVVAVKPDGRIRLCADFKQTINPVIAMEHHPMPKFEEIAVKLSGSTVFSVMDLKDAYLQMEGYFRYRRLPFGIKFAPTLFQKKMDEILNGIEHVGCMLDDIIIGGRTLGEHFKSLELVLERLESYQVKVKREKCQWNHENIFRKLRTTLTSSDTLVHFRDDLPIVVSADASEKGMGAVLMHKFHDGSETSSTICLTNIKCSRIENSSIDREALSLIFAVTKFQQYLYGKHFTLRTDHRPLLRILGEDKEIPKMAANRLARWAVTLSTFSYTIEYIPGVDHLPADTLSRLPVQSSEKFEEGDRLLQLRLDEIPVTKGRLQKKTSQDDELAKFILLQLATRMRRNKRQNEPTFPEIDGNQNSDKCLQRFNFDKFEEETEEWRFYVQRFEIALKRHGIPDDDDVRGLLLLSSVGPMVFKMLTEYFHSQQISTTGYTKLKHCLDNFYASNDLIFANRRAFGTRFRHEGESLRIFFKELRSIASICQFGRCLEEHLRDQIVIGINNDGWQQQLIRQFPSNETTLAEIERAALFLEQIDDQQCKLKELSGIQTNKISKPLNKREQTSQKIVGLSVSDVNAYAVSQSGNKAMLDVEINGVLIAMLYDPGASETVISERIWKKLGSPMLLKSNRQLVAYTDVHIETLGKSTVTVRAFDQHLELPVRVIKQDDVPLFGFNWCQRFGLPLPPGARVCNVSSNVRGSKQSNRNLETLLNKHKVLFDNVVGTIRGEKVVVHMDPNACHKICKPRPVPFALKGKVEEEIDRLLKENIIEPVDTINEPLEWASPV
ncbi:hypothetical protein EPUL_005100, partial [Erysiphe pulchra]